MPGFLSVVIVVAALVMIVALLRGAFPGGEEPERLSGTPTWSWDESDAPLEPAPEPAAGRTEEEEGGGDQLRAFADTAGEAARRIAQMCTAEGLGGLGVKYGEGYAWQGLLARLGAAIVGALLIVLGTGRVFRRRD